MLERRHAVQTAASAAHPERYPRGAPRRQTVLLAAYISIGFAVAAILGVRALLLQGGSLIKATTVSNLLAGSDKDEKSTPMSVFAQAALVMVAAVIAVPIFKKLGFGAVLGYLFAGVFVGPGAFNVVGHVEEVLHIAELGVVFFLFLVGIELQPRRLWELRKAILGLGNGQVLGATALLTALGLVMGLPIAAAVVAGMGLSLSSTAIALQSLADRGIAGGRAGQSGFAVLLFQDLAVVPLLAVIPLLAGKSSGSFGSMFMGLINVVAMVALFLLAGRLVLRPLFRFLASTGVRELSTIVTLLLVIGAGLAMNAVGMSMALGAFLAGVLLAESEFRHELEAAIDPFKGILLGLFFMAIGMSANLTVAAANIGVVVVAVLAVVLIKTVVLFGLLSVQKDTSVKDRGLVAAALSQGGEFAFVLYGVAAEAGVLSGEQKDLLIVIVSLSMATTPMVMPFIAWLADRFAPPKDQPQRDFDVVEEENPIIIAGFGRFGQIVGRVLVAGGYKFTALESDVEHVDFVRRYGNRIYYGDASHLDLLRASGIERARAFVLAVDDVETSIKIATIVKGSFPKLPIYARVRNRQHAYKLMDLGVHFLERELLHSSLSLGQSLLTDLDGDAEHAAVVVKTFRERDEALLKASFLVSHDEALVVQNATQAGEELRQIFEAEAERRRELLRTRKLQSSPGDEAGPGA